MFARGSRSVGCAVIAAIAACSRGKSPSGPRPPAAEFIVSTPDSAFWITTTSGTMHVRGAPIVIARIEGRFFELFSADDDFSYENGLLVGERLYRRDLVTGDSAIVFSDTMVARVAGAYARSHPDERPLRPDEEGAAAPTTSATSQIDILDVAGPYLSYEYHADVTLPSRRPWHTTRRGVIDLRSGKDAALGDLFGADQAARVVSAGRRGFESARDSIDHERASFSGDRRRAADVFANLAFDEKSFALSNENGMLQVRFAVPGRGEGAAGNTVELDAISVDSVAWWTALANGAARADAAGNDSWRAGAYQVLARYDTSGDVATLSIADSAKREWPVATILGPVQRIDWLDRPSLADTDRRALVRAFNQAAAYDENARVASNRRRPSPFIPVRLSLVRR